MQYAKTVYEVNHVEAGSTTITKATYLVPRCGGFVRAKIRDVTGRFIEPEHPNGAGRGDTWVAVGGNYAIWTPPCDSSYLTAPRTGDFMLNRSINDRCAPAPTLRKYFELVSHLLHTSVKEGLADCGLFAEQDIPADARILEYTGNRVGGVFRDYLHTAFK